MVLLKNDNDVLPISKDTPLIFLAGKGADDIGIQCGGWTIEWQGVAGAIIPGTTIKEALRRITSGMIYYNCSGNFEDILDRNGQSAVADIGIVVVSEKPYAEGMGDSDKLVLGNPDTDLIDRVSKRSKKTVVIIISGRPLVITDYIDKADAWVAAWLPGTEGQGIADVIFGDVPFTGKTPFTWPASMKQIPLGSGNGAPLFPCGFGIVR
ncbi:MAG: glycoside hydrolase family 3 C-terminal domain-containing protein [Desulfobacterales bacterium]|nr:glycoside hydrolase family 3 C-terminal domain-containing protein [Desulfobacterales bacterium]